MPLPTQRDVHIDTALSNLSVAYRQDMPPVSEMLFPRVSVTKVSDRYYVWNKADRWRHEHYLHSPGDNYKRRGMRLSSAPYLCLERGSEYQLPDQIAANADVAVDLDMAIVESTWEQIWLDKDIDFAAKYMVAAANWQTGVLGNGKWDQVNSTPIADVLEATRLIRRAMGSNRNYTIKAVCGNIVENRLLTNGDIVGKIIPSQVGTIDFIRQLLANILGIDELIVVDRERTTSKEGAANQTFAPVFDDDLLVLAVPNSPGLQTPSAGYTFAWNEAGRGDVYVETYRDEPTKSDIYRGICYYDHKQVDPELGVLFVDCAD